MVKREKEIKGSGSGLSQLSLVSEESTSVKDIELLKTEKTIRIAVTGDVFITSLEREIIDTPDFQRLRGIRQLGNVFHVYPTALHTRFDHCLGTLAMADKMIQAIRNNTASTEPERSITPTQEVIARLYALLHDITHIPFGHTIEDELKLLTRHDENPSRILRFLGPSSAIGSAIRGTIGNEGYARFMHIYLWEDTDEKNEKKEKKSKIDSRIDNQDWDSLKEWLVPSEANDDIFIHDLVSNTVCADLLDYVMRDNYFCNLGIALEYRFVNFLYLSKPQNSKYRRTFVRLWKGRHHVPRRDTMTDLARLLEARYMIAERAYFHHAKIISGVMLGRAIQEQIIGKKLQEEHLYEHTDDSLLWMLRTGEPGVAKRLAGALCERRLHKVVGQPYRSTEFDANGSGDVDHNLKATACAKLGNQENRRIIENELAEKIGAEHGDVLIYAPPIEMSPKAADMNVRWSGQDKKFRDIDDPVVKPRLDQIIKSHEMLWGIHLLATREIAHDEKRSDLLRDAFESEFLCAPADRAKRTHEHYKKLIDFNLKRNDYAFKDLSYVNLSERIDAAAIALATTARGNESFTKRLKEAIDRFVRI